MDEPAETPTSNPPGECGEGVLGLLLILARFKKMVAAITLAGTLAAIAISFATPKIYVASAVILPPPQGGSSSLAMAALGQAGALATMLAPAIGLKKSSDQYIGILRSRTIADRLVQRFDLQRRYDEATQVETRKELDDATKLSTTREGLISIEVEDEDPKQAAAMANAYVEELEQLLRTLAVTEASQRRLFFEKRFQQTKVDLANAETALKQTQERTGLIQLGEQGQAIISVMAKLKAQIVAKEAELSAIQTFASARNPELLITRGELTSLRAQLASMEKSSNGEEGDVFVPTKRIPEGALEYLRHLRDVRYHETLYELLAKQYELAKVDEAKDTALMQVVDRAVAPDKKSRPKHLLIAILALLGSFLLAVFFAALRAAAERARSDPAKRHTYRQLREYLRR